MEMKWDQNEEDELKEERKKKRKEKGVKEKKSRYDIIWKKLISTKGKKIAKDFFFLMKRKYFRSRNSSGTKQKKEI